MRKLLQLLFVAAMVVVLVAGTSPNLTYAQGTGEMPPPDNGQGPGDPPGGIDPDDDEIGPVGNVDVFDLDYDDSWVDDVPETVGGFSVGHISTPKDWACSSAPVIYVQSPRATLNEYLSNPPDISSLRAAIHATSGVPAKVTLSLSPTLFEGESAATEKANWNNEMSENGCLDPLTDISDGVADARRGYAAFQNKDAGRYTDDNAQGVNIRTPSGFGTGQRHWSAALNNVKTNTSYFLQAGLYFKKSKPGVVWTEDKEGLKPRYFSSVPHLANTSYQFSITYGEGVWHMCAGNNDNTSQYQCILSEHATGTHLKEHASTSVFFENANSNANWHSGFPSTIRVSGAQIYRNGIGQAWSREDRITAHRCHPDSYPVSGAMSGSLKNHGSARWRMSGIPLAC